MYLDLKLNILYPTVFNEIFISYITFYISDKKTNNDLESILSNLLNLALRILNKPYFKIYYFLKKLSAKSLVYQ